MLRFTIIIIIITWLEYRDACVRKVSETIIIQFETYLRDKDFD